VGIKKGNKEENNRLKSEGKLFVKHFYNFEKRY
jgi:hypothetical protein